MNNTERMTEMLMKSWGGKTLSELHRQAKQEPTGIAFDAMRVANGPRLMLVICVTRPREIQILEKAFDFSGGSSTEDWSQLTLLQIAMRAAAGHGFAYEALADARGTFTDIVLISTEPKTMGLIERLFTMPK